MVYATRGLVGALCSLAAARDPNGVTVSLATVPGRELETDVPEDAPVFTDFYFPSEDSVSAVFGVDLSTPTAQGRFVSHPDGTLGVTREDDLHEVVFVVVPPYDVDDVTAYDRRGRRLDLDLLDAEPMPDSFDE